MEMNNKNGLDEMQKQKRNSIGNQMFILMTFALFINNGFHSAEVIWLSYPANIMVIVTVCLSIYLVRLVVSNAYLPSRTHNAKPILPLILAIILSVILTLTVIYLFNQPSIQTPDSPEDKSALILMIVSAVGLFGSLLVGIIKKVSDKDDKND